MQPQPGINEQLVIGNLLGPAAPAGAPPPPYKYVYVKPLGRGGYGVAFLVNRVADNVRFVVKILCLQPAGNPHQQQQPHQGPPPGFHANQPTPATANNGGGAGEGTPGASPPPSAATGGTFNRGTAPGTLLRGVERTTRDKVEAEIANLTRISAFFGCTRLVEGHIVDNFALLFLEYCDAGDLHTEISRMRRKGQRFTEDVACVILMQLVFALHHLHGRGMLHRDVKAANVFLCSCGLVKIGDFGLSKTVQIASTFCGTPTHVAPEVWQRSVYGQRADVWSLGVVMYHLLSLRIPFSGNQFDNLRRSICGLDFPRLTTLKLPYSHDLLSLCDSFLSPVETRPMIPTILRHPLLVRLIGQWPALIRNSHNVPSDLRPRIMQALVDEQILAPLPDGNFDVHPRLQQAARRPGQPPPEEPGVAAEADFTIDEATFRESHYRDEAREKSTTQLLEQDGAPSSPLAAAVLANGGAPPGPPPAALAAAGETPRPAASAPAAGPAVPFPQHPAAAAAAAVGLPPNVGDAPQAGPRPVVRCRGLVWKAKRSNAQLVRWSPRGLMLTDTQLALFDVDEAVARRYLVDGIDDVADSTQPPTSTLPNLQRLPTAKVEELEESAPMTDLPLGQLGVIDGGADATLPQLYPFKLVVRGGKIFELAVAALDVRQKWMDEIGRVAHDAARRRMVVEGRGASAAQQQHSEHLAASPPSPAVPQPRPTVLAAADLPQAA